MQLNQALIHGDIDLLLIEELLTLVVDKEVVVVQAILETGNHIIIVALDHVEVVFDGSPCDDVFGVLELSLVNVRLAIEV